MAPLLSVIVPTHGSPFLTEALLSVSRQEVPGNLAETEIVVLDNSTAGLDLPDVPGLNVVKVAGPLGPEVARAEGIRRSSGELLALLDHDDIWLPGKVAAQLAALEQHPDAGFCYCQFTKLGQRGEDMGLGFATASDYRGLLRYPFSILSSGVIMRRSAYDAVGGYRESGMIGEDIDLYLRMLQRSEMTYLPEPLFGYRQHEGNRSGDWREAMHGVEDVLQRHLQAAVRSGDDASVRAARDGLRESRSLYAAAAVHEFRTTLRGRQPIRALGAIGAGLRLSPAGTVGTLMSAARKRLAGLAGRYRPG